MTSSGTSPGDDTELEQEGIWEESRPRAGPAPTTAADGLTSRLTSTSRTPGPAGLLYADVPNRIIALVVDGIILTAIGFVLSLMFGGLVAEDGAIDGSGGGLQVGPFMVVAVLQAVISVVYFGVGWKTLHGTPGMRLLGLRIGDEVEGGEIGWRAVLLRWLLLGVPWILVGFAVIVPDAVGLLLSAVGAAWLLLLLYTMAQSPSGQGLHDRVAHTIVVRARRRSS
jgi:uncharacterized RDD family membrane protein YckC